MIVLLELVVTEKEKKTGEGIKWRCWWRPKVKVSPCVWN